MNIHVIIRCIKFSLRTEKDEGSITEISSCKRIYIGANKKGVYLPHQIIESELELMEKLNVSRITIRRALEELVHDKVLTKKKGVGTFVNPFLNIRVSSQV